MTFPDKSESRVRRKGVAKGSIAPRFISKIRFFLGLLVIAFTVHAVGNPSAFAFSPLDDNLTEFDFLLLGLSVRPEPEVQVVPRNTPTGINVEIGFAGTGTTSAGLLSLLPPDLEVAAELVGPGIGEPIQLRGAPGELLPVPPLVSSGYYLVRDIRLERAGEIFLRAIPDTATMVLAPSAVAVRPLSTWKYAVYGGFCTI